MLFGQTDEIDLPENPVKDIPSNRSRISLVFAKTQIK